MSLQAELFRVFDEIVAMTVATENSESIAGLRNQYAVRRGRVFEDDDRWESDSQIFLEWLVAEAPMSEGGAPRAVRCLESESDPDRDLALAWVRSHRSVFRAGDSCRNGFLVEDIIGGGRFAIDQPRDSLQVSEGDVFEARLLAIDGRVVFGRGFVFHPAEVAADVARRVGIALDAGTSRFEIMDELARLRVKVEHYRHVPVARLYRS